MKLPRPRLTYANVISTLCLFILLGGGAYAATQLPKNSVGTAQIRKHAVTKAKLGKGLMKALNGAPGTTAGGNGGLVEAFAEGGEIEGVQKSTEGESFTFAQAGRPFVFADGNYRLYCSASGTTAFAGLLVDGKPTAASGEEIPTETFVHLDLFGLGRRVAAGKHTISFGFACENGSVADLERNAELPDYGVLLVGN
jgi:hypothetical protein